MKREEKEEDDEHHLRGRNAVIRGFMRLILHTKSILSVHVKSVAEVENCASV